MTRARGRPPASEAPDTRERIVAAAVELFADKGFHGTGVAEIGAAADVQRGALYYHIRSKEELLWEILRDYVAELLTAAESTVATDLDPAAKLRRLVREHTLLIGRLQRQVAIQLRDGSALTGERGQQLQHMRDRVQRLWQQVLDDGHAQGQFASSDHIVTNSLLSMANMVAFWYRPDGPKTLEEIADVLANLVFDGLIRK